MPAIPGTRSPGAHPIVHPLNTATNIWDPDRWRLPAVIDRMRAAARRHRAIQRAYILIAVLVIPFVIGAVATAHAQSATSDPGTDSALAWTNVRDSHGVPLWHYTYVTTDGSLFSPIRSMLAMLLVIEFNGWWILMMIAIWLVGYGLSFRWLDLFSAALNGAAKGLSAQVATTTVLLTAVTIGAFFVAYFVARGMISKAVKQVVMMLAVALFGVVFLADPLADVLSSHGWLAQGRDVGISVAAGLNGNTDPDPANVLSGMQATLADNLVRKPLQVWNFGHVLDERGSCGNAWSTGMTATDSDYVRTALRACGDYAADQAVEDPGLGKIGIGLVLLISGFVLIFFAAVLALKVIRASLDCVYHGILAIFGFAAGGYIYGPTQTFLIRNLIDSVFAALSMAAYTVFLGVYVLFLGNLFEQADGQVFAVLVITAIVEVIAIKQMRRLADSLDRGGEWVANRFAMAVHGVGASAGTAIGMGGPGLGAASHQLSRIHIMAMMGAVNTLSSNPLVGHLFGRRAPFDIRSEERDNAEQQSFDEARRRGLIRDNNMAAAAQAADRAGGIHTPLGVARALSRLRGFKMLDDQLLPAMLELGADPETVNTILDANATVNATQPHNPNLFAPLQRAVMTWYTVMNKPIDTVGRETHLALAANAVQAFEGFAADAIPPGPFIDDQDMRARIDWSFIDRVKTVWDSKRRLSQVVSPDEWETVSRDTRLHLGKQAAHAAAAAVFRYYEDPTPENALEGDTWIRRVLNIDDVSDGPDAFSVTPGTRSRG